jgi:hypothetical protein
MRKANRPERAKKAIEKGEIDAFSDIFIYVTKTYIAEEMKLNYKSFVSLTLNIENIYYGLTNAMARVLDVDPKLISSLIHNEIASREKPKKGKPKS